MANLAAFYETKNLFTELTQFSHKLTYEEWCSSPRDHKAALLFVNFFTKMTQAWDKANNYDFIPGEDGVSIVCQYLEKNVSRIENEPNKFSEAYIYTVAYNCMYCICHDIKAIKDRWENETDNVIYNENGEVSVFELLKDQIPSAESRFIADKDNKAFWNLIEGDDPECQKVIDYLLSGDPKSLKKLTKRSKQYNNDPLRDVEVSLDRASEIAKDIKAKLESIGITSASCAV